MMSLSSAMSRGCFIFILALMCLFGVVHAQTPPPIPAPTCPDPGIPYYGYRHGNVNIPGAVVSFGCDNGFELFGATVRRCTFGTDLQTGVWSGVQPICDPVVCGPPEEHLPADLVRTGAGFTFNSVVSYACKTAKYPLVGNSRRQCQFNGAWTGSTPSCAGKGGSPSIKGVECSKPGKMAHGSWDLSRHPKINRTTLTYYCNDGFELKGSRQRTCRADRTWSSNAPTCVSLNGGNDAGTSTGNAAAGGSGLQPAPHTPDLTAINSTDGNATTREGGVVNEEGNPPPTNIFDNLPILAGAVAAAIVLILTIMLVAIFISRKRRTNHKDTEKEKDSSAIYANSALFSPSREQRADPSKRLSTSSGRPILPESRSKEHLDDLSEESSQMSSETPPLPPPPRPNELLEENLVAQSVMRLGAADTLAQNSNQRKSTASLSVLALDAGHRALRPANTGHRRSDPLPVAPKPKRPPVPAVPVASNIAQQHISESEDGPEELYEDTVMPTSNIQPFRGTISKRPAAPLPKPGVGPVPSLNPLERLHRSFQRKRRDSADQADQSADEPSDDRYKALMHTVPDAGCYSEVDGEDGEEEEDEDHLYEPAPSGWGNRLSFSYDDVAEDSEDDPSGTRGKVLKSAGTSNWGDLQSDMAVIEGHLDASNTNTMRLSPVAPTEAYDSPVDALGSERFATLTGRRRSAVPKPIPPPKHPSGLTGKHLRNSVAQATKSSSSYQSDDYHVPIDAAPADVTAACYNQPYAVPLESIEFDECYNGDYSIPVDCPGSNPVSRHSSTKRSRLTLKSPGS